MNKLLSVSSKSAIVLILVLEVLSIGMGMGVPVFTILLGFPIGWFAASRRPGEIADAMRGCYRVALLTAGTSALLMAGLWLPWLPSAWGTDAELVQTGIPLILYEPRASFIGWLVLMVIISPAIQLLATLSASYVTLMRASRS